MKTSNKTIIELALPSAENISNNAATKAAVASAQTLLNNVLQSHGITFHASLDAAKAAIGSEYVEENDSAYIYDNAYTHLYAAIEAPVPGTTTEIVGLTVGTWGFIDLEVIGEALKDTRHIDQDMPTNELVDHVNNMRLLTQDAMDGLISYELRQHIFPDCKITFDRNITEDSRSSFTKEIYGFDPISSLYSESGVAQALLDNVSDFEEFEDSIDWHIKNIKESHLNGINVFSLQHQALFDDPDFEPDASYVGKFIECAVQQNYEVENKFDYRVATIVQPYTGNEPVYFTPNNSVASATDLVVDEHYLKGLDILKINLKEWIKSLAKEASLPEPNLALSAAEIVERNKSTASYKSDTGIHFRPAMAQEAIASEVFGMDFEDIPETIFNLVVESYRLEAQENDHKWMDEQGIDLSGIMSSKECYERFPKLVEHPNLVGFFQNAYHGNSLDYEWSEDPRELDCSQQLISNESLISLMNNASYGGALAFSLSMHHDDIEALKKITSSENFTVSGGQVHIHDWINGSGDCAPMQNQLVINGSDVLNDRKWYFKNDLQNSYGVSGVFSEFTGADGSMKIEEKPELQNSEELSP